MRVALVHPPTCDPTAPYVAVPLLSACLRRAGFDVLPVDANVEVWDALLREAPMRAVARAVRQRFAAIDRRRSLTHAEAMELVALFDALPAAVRVPGMVEEAVRTLRDRDRFFVPEAYELAVETITEAASLLSAASWPIRVDFTSWRSPFSLLNRAEVEADAARDPLGPAIEGVARRIRDAGAGLVGVSIVFPGQVQPAFTFAHALGRILPGVPRVAGGPALTQMLLRIPPERRARAIAPFDAAVMFEGEEAIVEVARTVAAGGRVHGVIQGASGRSLADLPAPDFDGIPLDRYLSPEPVLPYDPSRGCWWGRCAFCHYGLAERGTSCYRERPPGRVVEDLASLSARHRARLFYFSNDSLAPRLASDIARRVREAGLGVRWASDLRPDRAVTPRRARDLAAGGALAFSLGVESGSERVSALIDKGATPDDARAAIRALAAAGIAAEAMCFTGFPTETAREAMETVRFIRDERASLSLFVCGEFALTHGSRVAADPSAYGVEEVFTVRGDEYASALLFREARPDDPAGRARVARAIERLSRWWRLRPYPFAGSLSTAHTLLWYDRYGPSVFRDLASLPPQALPAVRLPVPRHDIERLRERTEATEAAIWHEMTRVRREVSRGLYARLAAGAGPLA